MLPVFVHLSRLVGGAEQVPVIVAYRHVLQKK